MSNVPTKETIEQRVLECVVHNSYTSTPKTSDHLVDDLGLDSDDQIELFLDIKDEFDLKISDAQIEQLRTVQQIIDFVTAQSVT